MSEAVKGTKRFKIFKIACGGTHTLALTESGDILSWGYGNYVRIIII
jgi:alpha-tubulin suppressor-like RCC1 family protein